MCGFDSSKVTPKVTIFSAEYLNISTQACTYTAMKTSTFLHCFNLFKGL